MKLRSDTTTATLAIGLLLGMSLAGCSSSEDDPEVLAPDAGTSSPATDGGSSNATSPYQLLTCEDSSGNTGESTAACRAEEVEAVFTERCVGCHSGDTPPEGLDLTSPGATERIVDRASACGGTIVVAGDPAQSFLIEKLKADPACGLQMPRGGTPLEPAQIECIEGWIANLGGDGQGGGDGLPGIDETCCAPQGVCGAGLACIAGPADEQRCRPTCDLITRECPQGGVCATFGGIGACIPAAKVGEDCAPELCEPDGICVGSTADAATCHKRCATQQDCDADGTTCTSLNRTETKACL